MHCGPRANRSRQWADGHRFAAGFGRGSPCSSVLEPCCGPVESRTCICTNGGATLDNNSTILHQGARCNQQSKVRLHSSSVKNLRRRRRCRWPHSKAKGKEATKGGLEEEGQRRGGGAVKKDCKPIAVSKHSGENSPDPVEPNVPDVVPLGQSIPTMKLLAAFPRWTLKARSNFS